ncbi:hypothetical protein Pflav_066420 [Phytohabitans flavus]|uniref:Uncharacterized protein n=1 Tax=Phytohabitans flavus TaxID=1076124 RepID=A0A6F8Y283_9ACTN|nr:hypothetical protein Pflav_066420 [Phytohabitans flavus]
MGTAVALVGTTLSGGDAGPTVAVIPTVEGAAASGADGDEVQAEAASTTRTHRRPYAIFMRRTLRLTGSPYEASGLAPRTSGAPSRAASAVASSGIFCDCRSASTRAR